MASRTWIVGAVLLAGAWTAPRFSEDPRVTIRGFTFRPDTLVVPVGASVTWSNEDDIEHTVTSDSASSAPRLDGRLNGKRTSYRAAFTRAGTYAYYCQRH